MGLLDGMFGSDFDDPKTQFNMMLAAGLLGGTGKNLAGILGGALPPAMQARNQASSAAGQKKLLNMQMKRMERQFAKEEGFDQALGRAILPSQDFGAGLPRFDDEGGAMPSAEVGPRVDQPAFLSAMAKYDPKSFIDHLEKQRISTRPSNMPMSVAEWEYFQKLPKDQQNQFLDLKRQNFSVADVGGVPTIVRRPSGDGGIASTTPLSTLPAEVAAAAAKAGAVEGARTGAELKTKDVVNAQTGLAKAEDDVKYSIALLSKAKSHPGLSLGVGDIVRGNLPPVYGSQAGFVTLHNQIKGRQFLQAYETLKGGGHITEIEGEKATNALARLGRVQSPEDFREAATELQGILEIGIKRQRAKAAGRQPNSGQPPGSFNWDSETERAYQEYKARRERESK